MNCTRRRFLSVASLLLLTPIVRAETLAGVGMPEASRAVRDTLALGARRALAQLGRVDGYFADPRVKIGLPRNFAKAEHILRALGQGPRVDALVLTMNRAAEAAAQQAADAVLAAVNQVSLTDALGLLTGGDDAATRYFRGATEAQLGEKLLPILRQGTASSGLGRAYAEMADYLSRVAGIASELMTVEKYVSKKALDGIYTLMAEEERALRADPGRLAGSLLGQILGRRQ